MESNNVVIWYSIHIDNTSTSLYKPQKKHLYQLNTNNLNSHEAFQWINHGEILYKGSFFKVHHIETNKEHYKLFIELDEQKNRLIKNLKTSKKNKRRSKRCKIFKVLKNTPPSIQIDHSIQNPQKKQCYSYINSLFRIYLDRLTPPPRV